MGCLSKLCQGEITVLSIVDSYRLVVKFFPTSRLMKKTHILRCARSSRYNVLAKYASARRFLARLGPNSF